MKQGTLGWRPWAVFLLGALMVGACSSGDEPGAQPAPATAIADALTATAAPAPTAGPTAPAIPSPQPTVEATPEPPSEEDAVIAAWERYLDLGFAVRDKDPSPEALDFDSYVAGSAKERLEQLLLEQQAEGHYVVGGVESSSPSVDLRLSGGALVEDCVSVELDRFTVQSDEAIDEQRETRLARGRIERTEAGLVLTSFDAGGQCAA